MLLLILVFLGGVLTILSPCILPVLPFVFARSERRFLTSGLPLLLGMAATFAGIATLAAGGGAWAVRLNQYGRVFALLLLDMVFYVWVLLAVSVRRLHDLGYSGKAGFCSLRVSLQAGYARGTAGPNAYGPDPLG